MSKEQLAFILKMSAESPPPAQPTPAQMRAWFEAANARTPAAEGAMIESVSIGPCEAELIRFPGGDARRLVIYYHGGGFMFGSPRTHRMITTHLARTSGATVLSVDYRLAPEHSAPTAHDDCYAAYLWALNNGYAPEAVALSGDSAGGNMALAAAVRARDAGISMPACLVLMSPALDLAHDGESHRTLADAPIVNRDTAGWFNRVYAGDGDLRSSKVTPFYSDVSGLPPVLIHVGTWELLRDDSITISARINAAGGQAELKVWDGMCHSWQMFAPMLEEGMASIEEAGDFVRRHIA
jgi:acetyl esterase/lipase